ncbi:hypothetical protein WBG78_18865 [Chryseolinea sp. T2]|uniref:hypothetical protein n=1 Tax=Chryseolinea sp. T2 TaxID=3129255 RepID=UPI003076D11C
MRRLQWIVLIFGIACLYCGCSKPPHIHAGGVIDESSAVVREVRLIDTISPTFVRELHLEQVKGSAFQYISGNQVSYFAYMADIDSTLSALSKLAFPLRDHTADVSYHAISIDEWLALRRTVGIAEQSGADYFWDIDPESYELYASTKVEQHLLVVNRRSRQVMHRIE